MSRDTRSNENVRNKREGVEIIVFFLYYLEDFCNMIQFGQNFHFLPRLLYSQIFGMELTGRSLYEPQTK